MHRFSLIYISAHFFQEYKQQQTHQPVQKGIYIQSRSNRINFSLQNSWNCQMARPCQEAIDTFMSITGVTEAVAVQKLEVKFLLSFAIKYIDTDDFYFYF